MKLLRLAVDTNVLRGVDHEHLTLVLNPFELAPPVIASSREIVRKFLR